MAKWIVLALLVAGAAIVLALGGWGALVVYLALAGLAGALAYAAAIGGDWVRDASRSRFDRDERR